MTSMQATGTFEVVLQPLAIDAAHEGVAFGRLAIDKRFQGDLVATSRGEMRSAGTAVKGSAGYVAIEWVSGTLHDQRGTFALQHSGTMNRGAPTLSVTVVPDSGTDGLVGLSGRMSIIIESGRHSYVFDYTLG